MATPQDPKDVAVLSAFQATIARLRALVIMPLISARPFAFRTAADATPFACRNHTEPSALARPVSNPIRDPKSNASLPTFALLNKFRATRLPAAPLREEEQSVPVHLIRSVILMDRVAALMELVPTAMLIAHLKLSVNPAGV